MGNYAQRCGVNKVDHIFPAKDTKLLQKLLKTRGIYDETRSQILCNSLMMNQEGKIINRCKKSCHPCDVQKVHAVIDLVKSVDKGADLSNAVQNSSKTHCCTGSKSCIRLRDKSTQVKKPKSCCVQDRLLKLKQNEQHFKLNHVHSDPGKLEGTVQRTHCQTTCIQVLESVNGREVPKIYNCTKIKDSPNYKNLMKNIPRMTNMLLNNLTKECNKVNRQRSPKIDNSEANLYKNLCGMCNQVKEKKCKPCPSIKPIKIECCKNNVKTKHACTKTSSKKKNIKSLAHVITDQCCTNTCNKCSKQNLCVAKKSRKKASNECCKINKPKKERATEISNICCSLKAKPCKSYTEKKNNCKTIGSQNVICCARKKASQVKIHFFKKGTCQPVRETRCGFQCRPKITKSRYSCRSGSSRNKGKSKECKDFKRRQSAKALRSQCECDNNTKAKSCMKCAKPKSYYCVGKVSTRGGLNCKKGSKINKNKQDKSCCLRLNRCQPKGGILCQQHIQSECIIHEIQVKKSRRCTPCSKNPCKTKCAEKRVTYCSKKVNTGKVKVRSISSISAQKPCIKAKKVQSIVQKPKKERPERQAVRIGSSCSFDIEFYKDRPKSSKPVEKCEKKNKSRGSITNLKSFVKKLNKSTKTKQTCCMMCYFVDIYRNKTKSGMTVSCSTGSLKSSELSSVDCSSNDSINIQINEKNEKRSNMLDDYLSCCRKSFSAGMRKCSGPFYRNDETLPCSTEDIEKILKNGNNINRQVKHCSEIRFGGKVQSEKEKVSSLVDQCLKTQQNFFFRKLNFKIYPNIPTINFYTTNAELVVRSDEKLKKYSMKDILQHDIFGLSKYCNWALKIFMDEINSLKTIIKTCCRFVFST